MDAETKTEVETKPEPPHPPRPPVPSGIYERGAIRHTEKIGALAAAMAKAQGAMKLAEKSAENPHFRSKYADLASIRDACVPALSANGIMLTQPVVADGNRVTVLTKLIHSSGEWIEAPLTMQAAQATPQGIGSTITYAKRYGLAALVGVAAGEEDDDGNAGSGRVEPPKPQPRKPSGKQGGFDVRDFGPPSDNAMPEWGK